MYFSSRKGRVRVSLAAARRYTRNTGATDVQRRLSPAEDPPIRTRTSTRRRTRQSQFSLTTYTSNGNKQVHYVQRVLEALMDSCSTVSVKDFKVQAARLSAERLLRNHQFIATWERQSHFWTYIVQQTLLTKPIIWSKYPNYYFDCCKSGKIRFCIPRKWIILKLHSSVSLVCSELRALCWKGTFG